MIPGAEDPTYDLILGMGFCELFSVATTLRTARKSHACDSVTNAYLLLDYGNLVEGTNNTDPPYVQLLSTTNSVAAHADFVATRVNTNANATGSLNATGSQNAACRKGTGTSHGKGFFEKYQI